MMATVTAAQTSATVENAEANDSRAAVSRGTSRAGGRPRDASIDAAVLEAVSDVLEESGYGSLAVEKVARRAGVSKTAVYRRWPTRQHLVLAELQRRLGEVRPVDTGCTVCDLNEALGLFARTFTCMGTEFLTPLLADCSTDSTLREDFMTTLFEPPAKPCASPSSTPSNAVTSDRTPTSPSWSTHSAR